MKNDDLRTFDPGQAYSVIQRRLPHWVQAGTLCFITRRTADSMPRPVVEQWVAERNELLRVAGIKVNHAGFGETGLHWKQLLRRLPPEAQWKLQCALTDRFDRHLDACHGACLLRRRELAAIVGESLRKFDGERYLLTDFVVMPNHVHLMASLADEEQMLKQCAGWKRFTARQINLATGQHDEFWQEDAFDHLVRSPAHFDHYRGYIADNGPRAHLREGEYLWYSKV